MASRKAKTFPKEFKIEEILDSKVEGSTTYYLVKWEGYSMKDCTWEPRKHFKNSEFMIEEFEKKQQENHSSISQPTTTSLSARTTNERSDPTNDIIGKKRQAQTRESEKKKKAKKNRPRGVLGVDEPECISNYHLSTENKLELEIKWKPKPNGEKLRSTIATNVEVKEHYPRILCDFYETKLRFENC